LESSADRNRADRPPHAVAAGWVDAEGRSPKVSVRGIPTACRGRASWRWRR